jgi:hypothetical protein
MTVQNSRPAGRLSSQTTRCAIWLSHLQLYEVTTWSAQKGAMLRSYFESVAVLGLSNWHNSSQSAVPDPSMMQLIRSDVVRLSRNDDEFDCDLTVMRRRLERILYVIGSSLPTRYVQGLNELLLPLDYVLTHSDPLFENDGEIEATAFHALHKLVTQTNLRDFFLIGSSSAVLLRRLNAFEDLVAQRLPEVAAVVRKFGIHPMCYCFKWFSVMFAQEHPLQQILALWDDVFERIEDVTRYLFDVGLAHLEQMQGQLAMGNMSRTVMVLQRASACDLDAADERARALWDRDKDAQKARKTLIIRTIVCVSSLAAFICL